MRTAVPKEAARPPEDRMVDKIIFFCYRHMKTEDIWLEKIGLVSGCQRCKHREEIRTSCHCKLYGYVTKIVEL